MTEQMDLFNGTIFEANYLRRTYRQLTSNPSIALTELVANAWDAGATEVRITIPKRMGEEIIISDDGIGLSEEEFRERWQTLGYNRLAHQGRKVAFPDKSERGRIAFGRNGIGRHGMMCFADEYVFDSKKDGKQLVLTINSTEKNPVNVKDRKEGLITEKEHGLTLKARVDMNLPNPEQILNTLSKRFVADPEFCIYVNDQKIEASELVGEGSRISVCDGIEIEVVPLDVETSKKCAYQGIAFWQQKRLVGEPSWTLGDRVLIDGRTAIARRFVFVVKSDDLGDYILPDWTGFVEHEAIKQVYEKVEEFVMGFLEKRGKESLDAVCDDVKNQLANRKDPVSRSTALDAADAVAAAVMDKPTISKECISMIVDTTVRLAQMRTGQELLAKLEKMSNEDIEGLNRLLDKWTVRDACRVLDEIDRRLAVITAIRKLSEDKNVDELHVLHPLIADARWVFGPEFDSPEFVFNRQLKTAAKILFGLDDAYFEQPNKRPDLIVNAEDRTTYSLKGLEDLPDGVVIMRKILLVELKRGGFHITEKERNQALHYVEALCDTDVVDKKTESVTYVVGATIDKSVSRDIPVRSGHHLRVVTYAQIVDTAEKRLFNLRKILDGRYDSFSGMELFNQVHPGGYEEARQDAVSGQ